MIKLIPLLLLPIFLSAQNLKYYTKEVHTITWKSDTETVWKIDTISYSVPFDIVINPQSLVIDGYGTFKIDSLKMPDNSPYNRYYLPNGVQFAWIERFAYLTYPVVNKKSKIIAFYIN